jgi:predicted dinucleotide-binding enzyme
VKREYWHSGSGNIGGALGKKWAAAEHTIRYGVRDPHKPEVQELVKSSGGNASAGTLADAITFGDLILFAIPGGAMEETIKTYGNSLNAKIVIDSANNMSATSRHSLAAFAQYAPEAKVFRAFNSYGWENFEKPTFGGTRADLFYCGADGEPRKTMESLITAVGLNPVYLGGPEQADLVDSVLMLWFMLVRGQNRGRHLAFKLLRD